MLPPLRIDLPILGTRGHNKFVAKLGAWQRLRAQASWCGGNMLNRVIWLGPIIALGLAFLPMPYGYYQLLRVGVFCVCAFLAYEEKGAHEGWAWAFIACALIYNPIAKLSLGRELWQLVNGATIVFFGAHMIARKHFATRQGGI